MYGTLPDLQFVQEVLGAYVLIFFLILRFGR